MDPEEMTTQELTTAVAGRVGEVWAVLDRLAAGGKALAAAEQAGNLERVARVKTKLAEVESLIADYRELERRHPHPMISTTPSEALRGTQEAPEGYGSIHGYESPPTDPCARCGGPGWHPPCRRPQALRAVREEHDQPGEVRGLGSDPDASV
jgi:hypothetical protein